MAGVLAVFVLTYISHTGSEQVADPLASVRPDPSPVVVETPVAVVTPTPATSPTQPAPEVPEGFDGFDDMEAHERVALVTPYMQNSRLPEDIKAFFKYNLTNKNLTKLTRNNMAESLIVQSEPIPGLADLFLSIVNDDSESKDYRLYSIQHLAMSLPTATNRTDAEKALESLVLDSTDEDFSTRAILMVDYTEHNGGYRMDGLDKVIGERIADATLSDSTRLSLFALVGSRGLKEHVDLVRIEVGKQSSTRRAAIAALGHIGDRSDIPLLEELASSSDLGVSLAAKGAVKRLESKTEK